MKDSLQKVRKIAKLHKLNIPILHVVSCINSPSGEEIAQKGTKFSRCTVVRF